VFGSLPPDSKLFDTKMHICIERISRLLCL
jgi:hypothetical protein